MAGEFEIEENEETCPCCGGTGVEQESLDADDNINSSAPCRACS